MLPEKLQNAGAAAHGCKRNGHNCASGAELCNKLRRNGTFVPDGRSDKEREKAIFSADYPQEIRQKISNCKKCPKCLLFSPGPSYKETSSQFSKEKLQKRVDSVD